MIVTSDFRQVAQGNVDLLNEMLTELVPDQVPFIIIARVISVIFILIFSRQEHPEDRKLLEELGTSCKEIQVTQNLFPAWKYFLSKLIALRSDKQETQDKPTISIRAVESESLKVVKSLKIG